MSSSSKVLHVTLTEYLDPLHYTEFFEKPYANPIEAGRMLKRSELLAATIVGAMIVSKVEGLRVRSDGVTCVETNVASLPVHFP